MFSRYSILFKTPFVRKTPVVRPVINRRIISKSAVSPGGPNQRRYVRFLQDNRVSLLLCEGPPKTGKTWFACASAVQELRKETVKRIVITHPVDKRIHSKLIFDIFEDFYDRTDIYNMVQDGTIEISSIPFLFGRTINHAFMIANDMQYSTCEHMRDLTNCIGYGSRMVITGNLASSDVKPDNGLSDLIHRIEHVNHPPEDVRVIRMGTCDIHSNQIQSKIWGLYHPKPLQLDRKSVV